MSITPVSTLPFSSTSTFLFHNLPVLQRPLTAVLQTPAGWVLSPLASIVQAPPSWPPRGLISPGLRLGSGSAVRLPCCFQLRKFQSTFKA